MGDDEDDERIRNRPPMRRAAAKAWHSLKRMASTPIFPASGSKRKIADTAETHLSAPSEISLYEEEERPEHVPSHESQSFVESWQGSEGDRNMGEYIVPDSQDIPYSSFEETLAASSEYGGAPSGEAAIAGQVWPTLEPIRVSQSLPLVDTTYFPDTTEDLGTLELDLLGISSTRQSSIYEESANQMRQQTEEPVGDTTSQRPGRQYRRRPGLRKPPVEEGFEIVTTFPAIQKLLNNVLRAEPREIQGQWLPTKEQLTTAIKDLVRYFSVITFEATQVLQDFVNHQIQNNGRVPEIDKSLLDHIFCVLMKDTTRKQTEDRKNFNHFFESVVAPKRNTFLEGHSCHDRPFKTSMSRVRDQYVKLFITNLDVHIKTVYPLLLKSYVKWRCQMEGFTSKESRKISDSIFKDAKTILSADKARDRASILEAIGTMTGEEMQDDNDNFMEIETPGVEGEENEGGGNEEPVSNPIYPERQTRYIDGTVYPPRHLFTKTPTRRELYKCSKTKRRRQRRASRMDNWRRPSSGTHSEPIRTTNKPRRLNKHDKSLMRTMRLSDAPSERPQVRPNRHSDDEIKARINQFMEELTPMLTSSLSGMLPKLSQIKGLLESAGRKLYELMPCFSMKAKFLQVNPYVLHAIIRGIIKKTGIKAACLNEHHMVARNQDIYGAIIVDEIFQKYREDKDDEVDDGKISFISTDGMSCSVHYTKHTRVAKAQRLSKEDYKMQKERNTREARDSTIRKIHSLENPIYVGVDPGRRDLISCAIRDPLVDGRDGKFSLSINEFMERSGTNYSIAKRKSYENATPGLRYWLQELKRKQVYDHLYGHESQLDVATNLNNSAKYLRLRFKSSLRKKTTEAKYCRELLDKTCRSTGKRPVVIFFGNARFRHNSPGFTTGLGSGFFIKKLKAYKDVYVLPVEEFRTSIVCSSCLGEQRLLAPPQNGGRPVDNPWHVRRCASCLTWWNRDMNASRNMICKGLCEVEAREFPRAFSRTIISLPWPQQA